MLESHRDLPASADHEEDLRTAYQALCARHQQIDDFRGKLLALLPIASGAAALLLLRNFAAIKSYLTPIGIYGCAVTVGLFLYELYGVNVCLQVMAQAGDLETELQVPEGMGLFRDRRPGSWRELVGAEMASWVVYVSVFAGWLYVAGVGRRWWDHPWAKYILLATVVVILVLRWSTIPPRERHKRQAAAAGLQGGWQSMARRVEVGDKAPDFTLLAQSGEQVQLRDRLGERAVVLYFYPKGDPRGNAEACASRDSYKAFTSAGAEVIGISSDSVSQLATFAGEHKLPFTLLSDRGGQVRKRYGVPAVLGLLPGRAMYVIDRQGRVRRVFRSMTDVGQHVGDALEIVRQLQADQSA
jgi:peroxiredoxin Q/BCP